MTNEERQEKLLLLLLVLARDTERRVFASQQKNTMLTMRKIRRIVQRMSPAGSFRTYEWGLLQPQIQLLLNDMSWRLRNDLLRELQPLVPEAQEAATDYIKPLETAPAELIPRTQSELAETTTDGTTITLALLFGFALGRSRYSLQLAQDLNKKVTGLLMGDAPTQKIADEILKVVQHRGKPAAVLQSGSFANQTMARVKNTVAGAAWSVVTNELMTVWKDVDVNYWVWNAVLDPKTCPVCAPMHRRRVPKPTSFVSTTYGVRQPPVHPNCRCSVMPVITQRD